MVKTENIHNQCVKELLNLRDSLDVLSGKWTLPILQFLYNRQNEENSFRKIAKGVSGISDKMLSKQLKELERNQMVEKRGWDIASSGKGYKINENGMTAIPVIQVLVEWGKLHRERIKDAMRTC